MFARLRVTPESLPIVTSVWSTPGSARISRATRSAWRRVSARLVPSGARMLTSNSATSFGGVKPLGTAAASGTHDPSVAHAATTTTQRCLMTHLRTTM